MKHIKAFIIITWVISSIIVLNTCLELLTEANDISNLFGLLSAISIVYLSYYTKLGTKILLITNYFKRNKNV